MAMHYEFDDPLDVAYHLRDLARDIETRPTKFRYGPQAPLQTDWGCELDVAVGALREAADKIEKAVSA